MQHLSAQCVLGFASPKGRVGMKYSMIIICFGRPSSLSFKMTLNRLQTLQLDYFLHLDIHVIYTSFALPRLITSVHTLTRKRSSLINYMHRLQTQLDDQLDYFLYTCDVHVYIVYSDGNQ